VRRIAGTAGIAQQLPTTAGLASGEDLTAFCGKRDRQVVVGADDEGTKGRWLKMTVGRLRWVSFSVSINSGSFQMWPPPPTQ